MQQSPNSDRLKWILLFILALTWGSSFILIKESLHYFSAIQVGALRVGIAGLVLMPLGVRSLRKIPKGKLKYVILVGLLGNFFPMFLFPLAEVKVSSSVAGILNSMVPLFVLLLGALFFGFKNTLMQIAGVVLAFLGCALLIGLGDKGFYFGGDFLYSGFILLATIMYALNALFLKKYLTGIPALQLSGVVFFFLFFPSVLVLLFSGFFNTEMLSPDRWQGYLYLGILSIIGTALAMILFYKLIALASPVFASSVTYLMPAVAVFWGLVFGEELNPWQWIGACLILLGVYLVKEKKRVEPKN